jgi:type IV secretory pathway VirB2 component (pilin)
MSKGWVRWASLVAIALLVWVAADATWAQELRPIESVAQSIQNFLTGIFAVTIATIAVAVTGYLAWTGRIDKDHVLSVVIGCGIVFGAGAIVAVLRAAASR